MSILNVEHLSHGFGDRAIFQDVSFRLLKGEHIGLVGANGEGKSTFMSIITGKLQPDEGKVEWAKHVRAGYLDQHTVLEKGMTIRDVLKSAFAYLFEMEEQMNAICDKMGEASEDEMNAMMEELGTQYPASPKGSPCLPSNSSLQQPTSVQTQGRLAAIDSSTDNGWPSDILVRIVKSSFSIYF